MYHEYETSTLLQCHSQAYEPETENLFLRSKDDALDVVVADFGLCSIKGYHDPYATRVRSTYVILCVVYVRNKVCSHVC